jgi:hypothetical protein
MISLVEMAETYGNTKLAEQFKAQMLLLNIKMPVAAPEMEEEDLVPDSLRDTVGE